MSQTEEDVIYKGYCIRQFDTKYFKPFASWTVDGLEFGTIDRMKKQIDEIENGTLTVTPSWDKFKVR